MALYIFLHGIFTRDVTKQPPLGEHHHECSMKPITSKATENKTYYPWSFITHIIAISTITTAETLQTYHLLELYNTTHYGIYNNHIYTTHLPQPANNHTVYGAL